MSDSKIQKLANKNKESKVETAKKNAALLRGTILKVLNNNDAPSFDHDDMQLLKFHGIYQQEDRDARMAKKATGVETETWFMIRIKVPGGTITPEQYLAMDQLAEEVTFNQSLRLTTRQCFQIHGVLKKDLKKAIRRCTEILLPTICGCGDVERNIMAPPAPIADDAHATVRQLATDLSRAMTPQTNAYYEIWMDGDKVDSSRETEPVYGDQYLPRKFKTGIALPEDNSVDAHSQDIGIVADVQDGKLVGASILVGGGFGMTHKKEETFARLGSELGYVEADHILDTVRTIAQMFRDYGDRTDRKHARLKYVIEENGIEAFREEFRNRVDFELKPWKDLGALRHEDSLGLHEQGDGNYYYGLFIENGRIIDNERTRIRTAIREIVSALRPTVILTPNQNLLFGDLSEEDAKNLEKILNAYHIRKVEDLTYARRHAMACVALPTCGLALTESERVMPDVIREFEAEFERLGVDDTPITLRMTGCPNGCSRPYSADLGFVGHKPGHYDVFLGGRLEGDRLADLYDVNVPMDELLPTLRPLLEKYRDERMPGESFGDFYQRNFSNAWRRLLTGDRDSPARPRVEQALGAAPAGN